jgi:hypothetical protein
MRDFDDISVPSDAPRRERKRDEGAVDALLGHVAATGRADAVGPRGVLHLQRQVGNAGTSALLDEERSPVHDVVSSGGEPLDRDTKAHMEASLGQDFSDVRVHRDSAADESARAVQAKAYTVGSHVVFQRDAYDPSSDDGQHVLAHELTHVVQQRSGPVDGMEAPGGIKVSDPSDRFEREASDVADRVVAGGAVAATAPPSGSAVQRQEAEEEEDVQAYVQRQETPEEEEMQAYVQRQEMPEEEEEMQAYVQRQEEEETEPV